MTNNNSDQMQQVHDKQSTIVIFLLNGVSSLLGWNVVLAGLDFFQESFADYDIYSYLSPPLFLGYVIVGLSYHVLSNRFHYIQLIKFGNIGTSLVLVCMMLTALFLDQSTLGYSLLLIEAFLLGLSANMSQLTFFAMINYFSEKVVSWFTVGTAVSGLFVTTLRLIILGIAGAQNKSKIPIILYFAMAILYLIFTVILNITFCRSQEYRRKVDKFLVHHDDTLYKPQNQKEQAHQVRYSLNNDIDQSISTQPVPDSFVLEQKRLQSQHYFKTLIETYKQIRPFPEVILFTMTITFIMLTGPILSNDVGTLGPAWSSVIYLMCYNLGDTVGKYAAQIHNIFNSHSLLYVFFSRLFFFYPVTLIATKASLGDDLIDNYFFPFINIFLFAFTNGFAINGGFIMAFKVCPLLYKKYAGVMCGLGLQIGIILGNILEIPYAKILG